MLTERLMRRPARLLHAAPVGERLGNEVVGGDGRDGLVPVLNLDGGQADLRDIAVRVAARYHDPVAQPHHVVGAELDARHEAEDGVLEDQHQHGGEGGQTAQQNGQPLAGDDADDDEHDGAPDHDGNYLGDDLDGLVLDAGDVFVDAVDAVHQRGDEQAGSNDDPDVDDPVEDPHVVPAGRGDARAQDDRYDEAAQPVEEGLVEEPGAPVAARGTHDAADQPGQVFLGDDVDDPADEADDEHRENDIQKFDEIGVFDAEIVKEAE